MRLAPGAWTHAAMPAALALLVLPFFAPASVLALALAVGVLAFFRDPERVPPEGPARDCVLAAADGSVSVIREETDDRDRQRVRVGVFMNVTDVHVNRAPLPGTVESVDHAHGGHWPAFSKTAERNERLHIDFGDRDSDPEGDAGNEYRLTLVAGTVARRCHSYVDAGDAVGRGERVGHIAFSSRVDVLLPPRFSRRDLRVREGDTVRAGRSILAADPAAVEDKA